MAASASCKAFNWLKACVALQGMFCRTTRMLEAGNGRHASTHPASAYFLPNRHSLIPAPARAPAGRVLLHQGGGGQQGGDMEPG